MDTPDTNPVLARIDDAMRNRRGEVARQADAAEQHYAFQHLAIQRFKVGPFEFRDNICRVPESRVDEFIKLWDGLQASDRNQIVALKEETNTRSLREFKAVRGAIGTADIKAPAASSPAPKAGADGSGKTDAASASTRPAGGLIPKL